ncbi:hypothetical protein [Absidia glauca]|uniref:Major facilitator superfamily (MFS) profile domain-containing protein n=1 Tax=Absidia glauca TaxID=4829 RepID=A0A168LDY7_ABSGL|nr:hypothetical protein [Absidia glauca]
MAKPTSIVEHCEHVSSSGQRKDELDGLGGGVGGGTHQHSLGNNVDDGFQCPERYIRLSQCRSHPAQLAFEHICHPQHYLLSAKRPVVRTIWVEKVVPEQQKYTFMVLGQTIASFGGPLIYNIASKLVAVWFAPKDRSIANTLIWMALAPLVLPQIVYSKDDIPHTLIAIAVFSTVVAIPPFFIPSKPKCPPSKSALEVRMNFLEGIKQLLRNPTFLWIALLASINMGMGFSVSVLIIEAILPFGYSDQAAGVCASTVIFGGFASGVMVGYWAGKTSQYLMLIKMFAPMVVFSYICFIFQLIPNALGAVITACLINGFFAYGIFPVMLEFCSEGPDANPPNNMTNSIIAMTVVAAVGCIPVIWLDGSLKRLAVDGNQKKDSNKAWKDEQVVQLDV